MASPEEISDRKLGLNYWLVTHQKVLRRITRIVLSVVAAIAFIPAAVQFVLYLVETPKAQQWAGDLLANSINWPSVHETFRPKDIAVTKTEVVAVGNGLYDVLLWVRNPNTNWYAQQVPYTIVFSGQRSQAATTFVLPGEEKVIFSQNFRGPQTPTGSEQASVQFGTVSWQQLDTPDQYELPKFDTTGISVQNLPDQVTKTRVSAQITNRSISGFRKMTATVVLWSAKKPIAIGQTTLENVLINDQRPIDVRFPLLITNASETTVYFSADNLDKQNLIIQ